MTGHETKMKIYLTASQLFYDNGYSGTTVSEIIRKARTNKGSFYHHFTGKMHLGHDICMELFADIDTCLSVLFPGIEAIELLFLRECVFWHLFFASDNIRIFASEVFSATYFRLSTELFGAILDLSQADLSSGDLMLIQGVELALKGSFTSYVGKIIERLNEEELVRFYMRTWLGMYKIPANQVDQLTEAAYDTISRLDVTNVNFRVSIQPKLMVIPSNSTLQK